MEKLNEIQSFNHSPECALRAHDFFEKQAALVPDAIAVEFRGVLLSYLELNARANYLAGLLKKRGVAAETIVAISAERSIEMIAAVLGVLKTGAAYLPLDPFYPSERLDFMLEDTQARLLLTQRKWADRFPRAEALFLDELTGESAANESCPAISDNGAYVIYTSGSTGRPKGVLMPHRALANLLQWHHAEMPGVRRTLQFASLSFDVSFQEMFTTWADGGTLVLVADDARRDPRALWDLIVAEKIERIFLPFVALQQLAGVASDLTAPCLREIITAGEQLRITPAIAALFERNPACTLHNHYGPTESHVVTAFTLQGPPGSWPPLPPIGKPIANTGISFLNETGNAVAEGEAGEICISGACLARGYLNRPGITAEKFIQHDGERFYKTGDIGRRLPDGCIEYLGRGDDQVKIRGHRVEPGEIEAVLATHPLVKQVAVTAPVDPSGTRFLAAYVVTSEKMDVHSLRNFVNQRLPEYAVPNLFVPVESMPLTPSGKIDRRALPTAAAVQDGSFHAAPRSALEKSILEIWQSVLHTGNIGINDNFFEAGGDSLRLATVHEKIRSSLDINVPVTALFEYPTIGALAEFLSRPETGQAATVQNRAQKQREALARRRGFAKTP